MPTEKEVYQSHADHYENLILREDCDNNLPMAINSITALKDIDIIELGAGTGRLTRFLAKFARSIAASDLSMHMLGMAQKVLEDQDVENTNLCVADMRYTPYPNESADLVVAGWSFCYLAVWGEENWKNEVDSGLEEAQRILRPEGTLILLENYGTGFETPHPPEHLLPYFDHLKKQGFEDTWIRTDYAFKDVEEAAYLSGFFFGKEMAEKAEKNAWSTLPECTGLLWKRF